MTRAVGLPRFCEFLFALLVSSLTLPPRTAATDDPPSAPKLTASQRERLAQRERHIERALQFQLAGKLAEAVTEVEAKLQIEREVLGDVNDDVAGSLEWLGRLNRDREDWPAARRSLGGLAALRARQHGVDDWRSVDARRALAAVDLRAGLSPEQRRNLLEVEREDLNVAALRARGQYADATMLARRGYDARKLILGEKHPDTASTMYDLAHLLRLQGDYAAAKPLIEQAVAIQEVALGPKHPDTAASLDELASLLRMRGDYAAARPLAERALAIRTAVLGPMHTQTAASLDNVAYLLWSRGDFPGARALATRALAVYEATLGPKDPTTALSLNNLGFMLRSQGDYAAARPLAERALAISEATVGPQHPDTATCLLNLALLLWAQGDYAGARPLLERALVIHVAALGPQHPDTATCLCSLASLLTAQGNHANARPLAERALTIYEAALGPKHPNTATSLLILANVLESQEDYAAARPLLERARAIAEAALGPKHPDTARIQFNLAYLLMAQGDLAAARTNADAVLDGSRANLSDDLPALTERQQLARIDSVQAYLSLVLSLSVGVPSRERADYGRVLARKGLTAEAARRVGPVQGPARALVAEVATARLRLQGITQQRVPPGQDDEHLRAVRRAVDDVDAKEAALARAVGWKPTLRTPEQVADAVPADAALVDFVRYIRSDPPVKGKHGFRWEVRYAAFVVRRHAEPRRVEVGKASEIDEALAA
jgi:tetratricopeptide (TPR) repeat protein